MRKVMKSHQLPFFLSRALWISVAAVVLFAASCANTDSPHAPDADQSLLDNFAAHEAAFVRLLNMCGEDTHMTRITFNFLQTETAGNWPRPEAEWGISPDRWQLYNDLFTELGLTNGMIQVYPAAVWFVVSGKGMEAGGSGKGIAYLAEPPKTTEKSLDNYVFKDDSVHFAYRPIKDNWYLFVAKYDQTITSADKATAQPSRTSP